MSSCSHCEMHAGKGRSSHRFWERIGRCVCICTRGCGINDEIWWVRRRWITEYQSLKPPQLGFILRQQHIRQDGTVVQPSHRHPTPTQSHHLQVPLQSPTSDLPAGAPKRGEGWRWRHHLDIYLICLVVFLFFKGCSLSTQSFTLSLTGPLLHFKLRPWIKKDI